MEEIRCPECNSKKLIKAGKMWSHRKVHQKYLCKNCGRITMYPKRDK